MEEVWKPIKEYGGKYKISNLGRVKNNKDELLSYYKNNKGYCLTTFCYNGKSYHPTIHRLVAMYFIPNPNNLPQVNHKDNNKLNNRVDNLEWCNQRYNYDEGMKTFNYSHNEDHFFAKLKNSDVFMIYELFKLGFTRSTIAKIVGLVPASIEAIEKGISYRELGIDFSKIQRQKYKNAPNIELPANVREYFRDNTVLNTLIAKGKVSV